MKRTKTERLELAAALSCFFGRSLSGRVDQQRLSERYRQLAFATHPDRATVLGADRRLLAAEFANLQRAYEALRAALRSSGTIELRADGGPPRERSQKERRSGAGRAPSAGGRPSEHASEQAFAYYLHYRGRLTIGQLIEGRSWQRRGRPAVGAIAEGWGLLGRRDVARLLRQQRGQRRFCDLAVERGALSPLQRLAVLGQQHWLEPSLESYWLARGWFEPAELAGLRCEALGGAAVGSPSHAIAR